MFKGLEFGAWLVGKLIRMVGLGFRTPEVRQIVGKFEEFVRRLRRAGLLFVVSVAGLLTLALFHPLGFLLWLIALPLAGFASVLSMLWPTTHYLRRTSVAPRSVSGPADALTRLASFRSEIPLGSRAAFDLVIRRLETVERLATDGSATLLADEAERIGRQHLPRLVASFVALPADQRTDTRVKALTDSLTAISEELDDLSERLLKARTDRFETERQFIENRFPRPGGLARV